ncbi:hypothetical protein [Ferriphaselus amnicola]|nr:hypothetical protein [Ferriphaselus amnicola]
MNTLLGFVIGAYLLIESFAAAALLDAAQRISRITKYFLTGVIGLLLLTHLDEIDWMHLVLASALAFFVWQHTFYRWMKRSGS